MALVEKTREIMPEVPEGAWPPAFVLTSSHCACPAGFEYETPDDETQILIGIIPANDFQLDPALFSQEPMVGVCLSPQPSSFAVTSVLRLQDVAESLIEKCMRFP